MALPLSALNFFDPSPRFVDVQEGGRLAAMVPREFTKVVALTVDSDDVYLDTIMAHVAPDFIQLHGHETVERVAEIRRAFGVPVIKAIPIADTEDIEIAKEFDEVSDWLLFDAKPTTSSTANLPGGNGITFDWQLLQGHRWTHPWMLSGGLVGQHGLRGCPAYWRSIRRCCIWRGKRSRSKRPRAHKRIFAMRGALR